MKNKMEKKIYILKMVGILGTGIFSENKEAVLKLWEVFNDYEFRRLRSQQDWNDDEKFYWPENLIVRLETKKVYLHENETRALKAKKAHEHAKKVGIISKKKNP